jgi:hypothetical protein
MTEAAKASPIHRAEASQILSIAIPLTRSARLSVCTTQQAPPEWRMPN